MPWSIAILASLLYSAYLFFAKIAALRAGVVCVGLATSAIMILVTGAALVATGETHRLLLTRRQALRMLAVGAVSFVVTFLAIVGARFTSVANANILFRSDLLFALLIGVFFLGERLRSRDGLGLLGMAAGLALTVVPWQAGFQLHVAGDLAIAGAACAIAANGFLIKHGLGDVPDRVIAFWNYVVNGAVFLAFGLVGPWPLWRLTTWEAAGAATATGLCHALAILAYYYCLRRMSVWKVRAAYLTMPVFGFTLGAVFLSEPIAWAQVAGAVLAVAGYGLIITGQPDLARAEQ